MLSCFFYDVTDAASPFRVTSRGEKNSRILHGTRRDVVSVDRLKAVLPDFPPYELYGPHFPCSPTLYPSVPSSIISTAIDPQPPTFLPQVTLSLHLSHTFPAV
ncbi:unnamed protein product [Dibothriocephalus latus]|uniref:Uncharacterized protein n=1 Tax=Dibothriocephalus latus TaxID=60516 RepID=A0A3P7PJ34_DIBLA|nr:unnamed protein product [Dibothriocephalus latus]